MTVAATVATAPLLAAHFGQISIVSLPANLAIAPVVALMMWLGMLAAAVAQVAPALAAPLNVVNAPLIGFMDQIAHAGAALPGAVVDVRAPAIFGYAAMGIAWWIARDLRRWGPLVACLAASGIAYGVPDLSLIHI